MDNMFFYRIEGLFPPEENKFGMYGFSIRLDKEIAKKLFQIEINEIGYKNLQDDAKEIIFRLDLAKKGDEMLRMPYQFSTNKKGNLTFLLQSCTVPGNSCDLGIDPNIKDTLERKERFSKFIRYDPHNVDHHRQAYALLSIWLNWANYIDAIL